jgi:hypothetical protein
MMRPALASGLVAGRSRSLCHSGRGPAHRGLACTMDEKVTERLDAWWASLDEAARNELMDNPNALLSEAAAGSLGKDLLLVTRWGEGEWEAQIGDHVRPYIDRREQIREAKRTAK